MRYDTIVEDLSGLIINAVRGNERYISMPRKSVNCLLEFIKTQEVELRRVKFDNHTLENIIKNNFIQAAGFDIDPIEEFKKEIIREYELKLRFELSQIAKGNLDANTEVFKCDDVYRVLAKVETEMVGANNE